MIEELDVGLGDSMGQVPLRSAGPRAPVSGRSASRAGKLTDGLTDSGRKLCRGIREAVVHPLVLAYRASRHAEIIRADVVRWRELLGVPGHGPDLGNDPEPAIRALLGSVPEFRNVFYYRLRSGGGWPATIAMLGPLWWRPLDSLEINCPSIGPGLVVAHGYGAILTAERVGANCTIHQQVTVGWRDVVHEGRTHEGPLRPPILGDNVFLGTGAKVLGGITVGNDVVVGANAVVIRDVPDGCTAVGVPARLLPPRDRTFERLVVRADRRLVAQRPVERHRVDERGRGSDLPG